MVDEDIPCACASAMCIYATMRGGFSFKLLCDMAIGIIKYLAVRLGMKSY